MGQHHIFCFDDFLVDPDSWQLYRNGDEVHLEPIVLKLLIHLIVNRDRLVTRQELMDTVWGDTVISEAALSKAVARLRKALRDNHSHPRYIETVHSLGYRFVAQVEEPALSDDDGTPPHWARRGLLAAIAAIILLGLLSTPWVRTPETDGAHGVDIASLAVLPLNNLTGDPRQDYYADGLQEILITELSQIRELRITSRQSTKRYRDSQMRATDIARELGVDALVEGSMLRDGSKLEISIQLIDGRTDDHLWAQRYTSETSHVFDLAADVARSIGAEIATTAANPDTQNVGGRTLDAVDQRAIEAYALGLMHLDRLSPDGIHVAIEQFQQAVGIEPGFVLAWGNLAVAHAMQALHGLAPPHDAIEQARAAAQQAIDLNDQFYIGHSTLGWVRLWTGDLDGACKSFNVSLRLNPSAPYALHGAADCLMLSGRMADSVEKTRELSRIGPFSAMHSRPLAFHLFIARRFEEAVQAALATQARVPGYSVDALLARIYWTMGEYDKALEAERRDLNQRGDSVLATALEHGLEAAGPMGALHTMAEALADRANTSYVDPFLIAETFARAGSIDDALVWLQKAVEQGSFEATYIAVRPDFDVLRGDPRYRDLLHRIYGQGIAETALP